MIQFILRGDVKKRGSFGWYVPQMGVEGSMARPHLGQKTNAFCFASLQIFKTVLSYLDFRGRLSSWIYEKKFQDFTTIFSCLGNGDSKHKINFPPTKGVNCTTTAYWMGVVCLALGAFTTAISQPHLHN